MDILAEVKFDDKGLVQAITQDWNSREVLMSAYMNREALQKTIMSRRVHYYSRSRQELWLKGETSGHYQHVKKIMIDCDGDAVLVLVEQEGVACHTGNRTCFYRSDDDIVNESVSVYDAMKRLYDVILGRKLNPVEGSYTNYLFDKGIDKMLKKVGEESSEVIIAAKNASKPELTAEISDLIYHLNVVMAEEGVIWDDVLGELEQRAKKH